MSGRSHTASLMVPGSTSSATPTLTPSGNSGSFWIAGASFATSTAATLSTKINHMRVADPHRQPVVERAAGYRHMQHVDRPGDRKVAPIGARRPHANADLHGPTRLHSSMPPPVSSTISVRPLSSSNRCATQRVALPQARISRPSMLKIRIAASAPAAF
jgi:hypothetical protein